MGAIFGRPKTVLLIVLVLLVCLTVFAFLYYKDRQNKLYYEGAALSAIKLTDDELKTFEKHFDMQIPKNTYIQNCAYESDDSRNWFALKAVVPPNELRAFLKYLDDENNFENIEIYKREFKGIPIQDYFADALEWWNLNASSIESSYVLYYNDEDITGASAIVVCKTDNVNCVYFYYVDPALTSK